MANRVVKVKRETIEACMKCPLCNKLLKDATTISECLHTFCRKCICKKISDEGEACCPVCNIDLGCVPLEKLRPDHNLQDVRAKIFPFKRRKVEAPEISPQVLLPVRRKERSLSSLVINAPKVSTQNGITGRRTRPASRKATALRSFSNEKCIKKEEDFAEDHLQSSSTPGIVNKVNLNVKQNSSSATTSEFSTNNKAENGGESWNGKSDLWQPLNCLVEVANRSKSFKLTQVSDAKREAIHGHDNEPQLPKTKFKENKDKLKVKDENNNTDTPSDAGPPKRQCRIRRKKTTIFRDLGIASQAVLDTANAKHEKGLGAVWFSLVASDDQEGDAPLPQITANYLRIKNGSLPVSFIQKYLKKKLDLASEAEVEIKCMGQAVVPTLLLYNLVDLWAQTASSERVTTSVGSSAKDFVMVLAYARKIPHPE